MKHMQTTQHAYSRIRRLAFIALLAALTGIGAFVRIPLPFSPTPMTLQTFFVLLSGFLLGPRDGVYAQLLYIILGLCGVPVFVSGGGIWCVLTPGFGYLIGFLACAALTGFCTRRYLRPMSGVLSFLGVAAFGLAACYSIAVVYMYLILNFYVGTPTSAAGVLATGFAAFLPGEIVKMIAVSYVSGRLLRVIKF